VLRSVICPALDSSCYRESSGALQDRDVIDKPSMHIKSFVIENRSARHIHFPYEYRFTEYEHDNSSYQF
jgi:hypothetical protein